jgi:hypothetical protein
MLWPPPATAPRVSRTRRGGDGHRQHGEQGNAEDCTGIDGASRPPAAGEIGKQDVAVAGHKQVITGNGFAPRSCEPDRVPVIDDLVIAARYQHQTGNRFAAICVRWKPGPEKRPVAMIATTCERPFP